MSFLKKKSAAASGGYVPPKDEPAGIVHRGYTISESTELPKAEPARNLVAELADAFGLSSYNLVSFTLTVDGESAVVNGEYKVNVDGTIKTRVKKIGLHR